MDWPRGRSYVQERSWVVVAIATEHGLLQEGFGSVTIPPLKLLFILK